MNRIAAFVGHSFTKNDEEVVNGFLKFFDKVENMNIGFTYDHAKPAEPKELSQKVKEKIEDKNLFIGICTAKEQTIDHQNVKKSRLNKNMLVAREDDFVFKTSDWIIQEIGYALGKGMDLMIFLENGLRRPGGLQGDIEHIPFNRSELEKTFNQVLEMLQSLMPKKEIAETGQVEKQPKEKEREEIKVSEQAEYIEISPDWNYRDYNIELFKAIVRKDKDRTDAISEAFFKSEHCKSEYEQIHWKGLQLSWQLTYTDEQTLNQLIDLSNKNPEHHGISQLLGSAYSNFEKYDMKADFI